MSVNAENLSDGAAIVGEQVPVVQKANDSDGTKGISELGPIDLSTEQYRARPTFVLGIGGTAARTLRRLRTRLSDRFGDLDRIPAFGMLLVDTDQRELNRATEGEPRLAMSPDEVLSMSLRRPHQYRAHAEAHLQWLERRWLYNIPRSLKTEGLRPLGRLALVDHAELLSSRLRSALAKISAPDALAVSAQTLGVPVGDGVPRVYVLASISGGTGGGMILDAATIVRSTLCQLGFPDDGLVGLLLHSTSVNPDGQALARANAHACLTELYEHERRGTPPSLPACTRPPDSAQAATFPHTYLVPLGDELDERAFDAATDAVAQYVYLDAVTPTALFFDKCRTATPQAESEAERCRRLRTFRLIETGSSYGPLTDALAEKVCRRVVMRWQGENPEANLESDRAAERLADSIRLGLDALIEEANSVADQALGRPAREYFAALVAQNAINTANPGKTSPWESVRPSVDRLLGPSVAASDGTCRPGTMEESLGESLQQLASKRADAVADWLFRQPDNPSMGAAGSRRSARWLVEKARSLEADIRARLTPLRAQIAELEPLLAQRDRPGTKRHELSSEEACIRYCCLRLSKVVCVQVGRALRPIGRQAASVEARLAELGRTLDVLANEFPGADLPEPSNGNGSSLPQQFDAGPLIARIAELGAEVDRHVRSELLSKTEGLFGLLDENCELAECLPESLRRASRTVVLAAIRQLRADAASRKRQARLGIGPETADPVLKSCGGAMRRAIVAPEDELTRLGTIEPSPFSSATMVVDPEVDLTYCCEMEQLSIRQAAIELIDGRNDYADLASRLHTRIDVRWPRLI